MRQITRIAFMLAPCLGLVVGGCSSEASDTSEGTAASQSALTAGVPKREWLKLAVPQLAPAISPGSSPMTAPGTGPTCAPGATAGLADLTRSVSSHANGILEGVLTAVTTLMAMPPSSASDHHASWGPLVGSEPAGIYKFDVERADDGTIAFVLLGRASTSEDWHGLFEGTTRVVDADHRIGDVQIDLAAMHSVDPVRNLALTGSIAIHFGNLDGNVLIDMAFGGASGPETPPMDAKYKYVRRPDGGGAFEFVAHPLEPGAAQQLILVNTAWAPGGAGKARATVLAPSQPAPASTVECWAPNAGLVFKGEEGTSAATGDAACCVPEA